MDEVYCPLIADGWLLIASFLWPHDTVSSNIRIDNIFNGLCIELFSLNETEYNVCMLSLLPLSTKDVANLMELGESAVAKSRTNIRKKIGSEGYGSDIGDFILERYYISCQPSTISSQLNAHSKKKHGQSLLSVDCWLLT